MKPELLSVLIPLYNEEEFIRELLTRVVAAPLPEGLDREIIVVDDCSTDDSAASVEAFIASCPGVPVRLIRQGKNRGKGAAIRTAIEAATGQYSIIQDADLEYDPREYQKLLGPLLSGEADVVYGSRFMAAGERRVLYFWHSLANHILTTLCNIVADLNLTDMETCYKAFRTGFAKTIPIESDRFGIEPELTVKFARRKARIFEAPISYHGRTYEEGKKIGPMDAVEVLWVILRSRFTGKLYLDAGHSTLDSRLSLVRAKVQQLDGGYDSALCRTKRPGDRRRHGEHEPAFVPAAETLRGHRRQWRIHRPFTKYVPPSSIGLCAPTGCDKGGRLHRVRAPDGYRGMP